MKETKNTEQTEQQTVVILDDYSVIVAEKEALQAFFTDGRNLDEFFGKVEKMARGLVADPLTKEGASQIKTCARQIASVKKKVDDYGKDVVAKLKDLPNVIDENRRKFREKMEALQDEIRRPVTEIENREDEIDGIKGIHLRLATADSEQIKKELDSVRSIPLTEDKWHESLEKAKAAVEGEAKALALLMDTAMKREKEARELAELRKKQEEADRIIREQKIREEAERKAREQAEARAAAERARMQREKEEAERRAAEAEKRAREAQEAARKAAQQQNAPTAMSKTLPAAKPSAWTQEQKDINNAIVDAIAAIIEDKLQGFTESGYELAAREIVKAVLKGKISNLKVVYHE